MTSVLVFLLLFGHEGRCSAGQLVRRDHRHFLSIRRDRYSRYFNHLAIALVRLLNRVVIDALQRDRVVEICSFDGVVFAVQLRRITLAVGVDMLISSPSPL